jgi:hypothetical protein
MINAVDKFFGTVMKKIFFIEIKFFKEFKCISLNTLAERLMANYLAMVNALQ